MTKRKSSGRQALRQAAEAACPPKEEREAEEGVKKAETAAATAAGVGASGRGCGAS